MVEHNKAVSTEKQKTHVPSIVTVMKKKATKIKPMTEILAELTHVFEQLVEGEANYIQAKAVSASAQAIFKGIHLVQEQVKHRGIASIPVLDDFFGLKRESAEK